MGGYYRNNHANDEIGEEACDSADSGKYAGFAGLWDTATVRTG